MRDEVDNGESPFTLYNLMKILAGCVVFYILWRICLKNLMHFLTHIFQVYAKLNNIWTNLLFSFIMMFFAWFPIPGLGYFTIMMSYFMQDFWRGVLISFAGGMIGGIIAWFVIRHYLRDHFLEKYGKGLLFRVFQSECQKNPWAISVLSNILIIPSCMKNLILPLTEMELLVFVVPKIPFYAFFSVLFILVGLQIKDFKDLATEEDESFRGKTPIQQIQFIISILFVVVSIGIAVYFSWISKDKFDEFERRDRELEIYNKYVTKIRDSGYPKDMIDRHLEEVKSKYDVNEF